MEIERKVPEKKIKVFWVEIIVKVAICLRKFKNQGFLFTGFIPTGCALCCETWLEEKSGI